MLLTALLTAALAPQDPDFAAALGVRIDELENVDEFVDSARRERIAVAAGLPETHVAKARVYLAQVTAPDREEPEETVLVAVPLPKPVDGSQLLFALASSLQRSTGTLRGAATFANDPDLRWSMYLNTLREASTRSLDDERSTRAVHAAAEALDPLTAFLLEQRRAMQQNVLFQRQVLVLGRQGKALADPSLARQAASGMQKLAERADLLAALIGDDSIEAFREHAKTAARALAQAAALDPKTPNDELVEKLDASLDAAACNKCHRARSDGSGGEWRRSIAGNLNRRKLPFGVLRVGFDVAPALGDDGQVSQAVASAYHAARLLVAAIKE